MQQYRTRLNGQFSTLLSSLPPEVVGTEVDGLSGIDLGAEKRVSKAEVLILAKKHIENLERTKKSLENDKKALLKDIQRLKRAWIATGGDVMPWMDVVGWESLIFRTWRFNEHVSLHSLESCSLWYTKAKITVGKLTWLQRRISLERISSREFLGTQFD